MKYHLKLLIVMILMSSCVVNLQVNGVHDGYPTLTDKQKSKVHKTEKFQEIEAGFVYEITGGDLRRELANREQSMVNIFVNVCSSDRCYPMSSYRNYQDDQQIDVFLIMCDYFGFDRTMDQDPTFPIFAINTSYYKENKQKKYRRLFLKDLLNLENDEEVEYYLGKYLFFKGDSLVAAKKELF